MRLSALIVSFVCLTPCGAFAATCDELQSPFRERSFKGMSRRISARFGDYRASYVKGHLHSAIDVDGPFNAAVYALCPGRVVDVHLEFPHRTIVVEHALSDGTKFFASYKHLEDLRVQAGSVVDENTQLGRLFDADEQRRSGWRRTHVHLELRRTFTDGGTASWTTMTRAQLNAIFYEPLAFMKPRMQR